eukprot:6165671-Amphidinium_carterae.1
MGGRARPRQRHGFPLPKSVPSLHFKLGYLSRASRPSTIERDGQVPYQRLTTKPLVDLPRCFFPRFLNEGLPSFAAILSLLRLASRNPALQKVALRLGCGGALPKPTRPSMRQNGLSSSGGAKQASL